MLSEQHAFIVNYDKIKKCQSRGAKETHKALLGLSKFIHL